MGKISLLVCLLFLIISRALAQQNVDGEIVINLNAISGMQFDLVRFNVKPGVKVKINFTNTDDMAHNFLITKPGSRLDVVNDALKLEEKGPQMNYIPKSQNVLWSIPVVSTNQTATLTFNAPNQPGAYPYVCTYPGHGFIMYGVMYVSNDVNMPDLQTDQNIPPSRRESKAGQGLGPVKATPLSDAKAHHVSHPYDLVPPFLYRIFMDDSGPASIAVSLPQDISYCWDTGSCRLRYAWTGGFLDNTAIWKGHVDANAKILGTVFYREASEYPVIIGNSDKQAIAEFKGYKLIDKYPEFHYQLNGVDVFELIKPKNDGNGIVRNFRIPDAGNTVWFSGNSTNASLEHKSSAGTWVDGRLKLSPQDAKQFSITTTNYSLLFNTRRKKK
ncbi:plastocyanin/azurin family copper-binding protein [Daejeonella lutea]|uniref:Azurin n=1 Tax=Daejeonella lutea TaxID=572036 RepID=A0A1T5A781_9SPHI|nr:plastocyanin/azurin family copper-binding protein [Daejeonella lutea]SKB30844.1 Azurin [Daejeonella lutea]